MYLMRTSQQFILTDYKALKKKKVYINSLCLYKVTNNHLLKKYNKKTVKLYRERHNSSSWQILSSEKETVVSSYGIVKNQEVSG